MPEVQASRGLAAVVGLVLGAASIPASIPASVAAPAPAAYDDSAPRTWHVGPTRTLTVPSQAAAVARDGDTVLIDAGTYSGDVATWTQDDLTLRGEGGRAHLRADGQDAQGKAIWVIAGDRTTVDRIELSGAAVVDRNGAGIRQEGTGLTVTRSWFHDNENGILTGADPASDIVIRGSRFFRNGAGDGYSHNVYIGAVRSLTVTGSWLSGADTGHELKSRAARTTIVGNRISDGDSTASYSIDLPNGGRALVAGNVVVQGPASENPAVVSYGAEGLTHPSRTLWVVNNTFVNQRSSGTYVAVAEGASAHLRNNLLVGAGDLTSGPADARGNRRVGPAGFVAPGSEDFRLRPGSPAVNRGVAVPARWRARWEYVAPARQVRRPVAGRVDLGAFELR
ncbi:right-handed parallel beta-helix repeat-containing protein [Nocardioides renjunii]|uniref:right-handed parallel beta-helix repeat-containing protein n=1 Tax=Nocardioides renjunii TaxID=3095075 RepID=UPI002AFFB524|nr:right-handed parallel beta-helix repeat-containing protein [Nocardioides sp. S-34]WQQ23354.1 right-handed parallel beta-helix repeat-containing protein [Nocardioides sp. S-34]